MRKPALIEPIEARIRLIRGRRVLLDNDLALLYGVPTKRLNEQVSRNRARFPEDFVFRLTLEEVANLGTAGAAIGFAHSPNKA